MDRKYHFACLDKFPHWSEYLAPLGVGLPEDQFSFLSFKSQPDYVDPSGKSHPIRVKGWYGKEVKTDIFIASGGIHWQTHPLSINTVPYDKFQRKLITQHTTGWSPYELYQNASIAALTGQPGAKGAKITDLMKRGIYERFMATDFGDEEIYFRLPNEKWKFSDLQVFIKKCVDDGTSVLVDMEPSQHWLDVIPRTVEVRDSKYVGVAVNWCSIKTKAYLNFVLQQLNDAAQKLGKIFVLRMHNYSDPFDTSLFPFIEIEDKLTKYEFMDAFHNYVSDGTGLGYEIAYRNHNLPVSIYHIHTHCYEKEFKGTDVMEVLPVVDVLQWADNPTLVSWYPEGVLAQTFPHSQNSDIPQQCREVIYGILDKDYE